MRHRTSLFIAIAILLTSLAASSASEAAPKKSKPKAKAKTTKQTSYLLSIQATYRLGSGDPSKDMLEDGVFSATGIRVSAGGPPYLPVGSGKGTATVTMTVPNCPTSQTATMSMAVSVFSRSDLSKSTSSIGLAITGHVLDPPLAPTVAGTTCGLLPIGSGVLTSIVGAGGGDSPSKGVVLTVGQPTRFTHETKSLRYDVTFTLTR